MTKPTEDAAPGPGSADASAWDAATRALGIADTRLTGGGPARTGPPGLRLRLTVFEGRDAGRTASIGGTRVIVGRGPCDFRLTDPAVSGHHFALEVAAGEVVIRDLGTPGGTRVNGERISERTLHDRDEIRLGSTGIVFTAVAAGEMPAAGGVAAIDAPPAAPRAPAADPASAGTVLDGTPCEPKSRLVRRDTAIFLEVLSGTDRGRVFDLRRERSYLVGRRHGDVPLDDVKCSQKHARIEIVATGEYYVSDLESTNGTFVNEDRMTRRRLQHMDVLRIGSTLLRFSCLEGSIPLAAAE